MTKIYLFYWEINILNIFYTCYKYCFLRVLLIRLILVPSIILTFDIVTINSISVPVNENYII